MLGICIVCVLPMLAACSASVKFVAADTYILGNKNLQQHKSIQEQGFVAAVIQHERDAPGFTVRSNCVYVVCSWPLLPLDTYRAYIALKYHPTVPHVHIYIIRKTAKHALELTLCHRELNRGREGCWAMIWATK